MILVNFNFNVRQFYKIIYSNDVFIVKYILCYLCWIILKEILIYVKKFDFINESLTIIISKVSINIALFRPATLLSRVLTRYVKQKEQQQGPPCHIAVEQVFVKTSCGRCDMTW